MTVDEVIPARAPWSHVVRRGETLQIVDLGGNQAVDCLLYNADDLGERYSAADTMTAQRNILLVPGTTLMSNEGRPMMTITASTCAYHDTIGGACSRESNTLRYGHHTRHQHACVDNFLDEGMGVCDDTTPAMDGGCARRGDGCSNFDRPRRGRPSAGLYQRWYS